MNRNDTKNKDIKELMKLLLDDNTLSKNKIKIRRRIDKVISRDSYNTIKELEILFKEIDVDKYLFDSNVDMFIKEYIISVCFLDRNLIKLLKKDISEDLKKYIIDKKITIYNTTIIVEILKDSLIDDSLKDYLIRRRINSQNIIDIVLDDELNKGFRERIFSIKKDKLIRVLHCTSNKEIIDKLIFYCTSYDNVRFIEKYKANLLKNTSRNITSLFIRKAYNNKDVNRELLDKVLGDNKEKVWKVINNIKGKEAIDFFEVRFLPSEYAKIIINNNIDIINEYIDKLDIAKIMEILNNSSWINMEFKKVIFERRIDDVINLLNKYNLKVYLDYISYCYYNDELVRRTIDKKISIDKVMNIIDKNHYNSAVTDFITKYKREYVEEFLANIKWDDLINNRKVDDKNLSTITSFSVKAQSIIYRENRKYINNILDKYDDNTLKKYLNSHYKDYSGFILSIKESILKKYISDYEVKIAKIVMDCCNRSDVLNTVNNLEKFFNGINIDIEVFLQYGCYALKDHFIDNIVSIIDKDEIDNFNKVKDYLFKYYYYQDYSGANLIKNLNVIIENYNSYRKLLLSISNSNNVLSTNDKNNLCLLFDGKISGIPRDIYELEKLKRKQFNRYKMMILNSGTFIEELKDIFFNNIVSFKNDYFESIGDISSLMILQQNNSNNKEICLLIQEVITSMDVINKIRNINDREKLISIIISYIDREDTIINRILNDIVDIRSKIRRLYELDSRYNLTTLEAARKIPDIYNREYMELYDGEVFDFSDKDYVLYAHALSRREKMEDLVNGVSTGNSNFISFSPISYRGQKYYYNYRECILAYDKIPQDSFICSSLTNMGSNYAVKSNSAIVVDLCREQRGILETSSVKGNNAEALFYREGIKPCGIILVDGKRPSNKEIEYHNKYNLPFIITQKDEVAIDNPKKVFTSSNGEYIEEDRIKKLNEVGEYINNKLVINKENDIYTGREIAIFTDTHAMYEPTVAILEDIRSRDIKEIYSLGDNTSDGPCPMEVLDLLDRYSAKQIMGNSEYYLTLGSEPFSYFNSDRKNSLDWTNDKVKSCIKDLKLYKASREILVGDRKIALCHFGNDIRWDFDRHNTWTYQDNIKIGNAAEQFLFTNSSEYKKEIEDMIKKYGCDTPRVRGYLSSKMDPLFGGNIITEYDDVFEGHVHFELEDKINNTNIHTLRAVGMGELDDKKKDKAYYIILKEKKKGGFDIEKVLVPFNKSSLLSSIYASDMPMKKKVLEYLK